LAELHDIRQDRSGIASAEATERAKSEGGFPETAERKDTGQRAARSGILRPCLVALR
jgi:hypothetical protein